MKTENSWATALVGVTVLWGWSFVAIHESLSSVSAIAFNALRFLVGGIAMLVFLARKPRRIRFAELKDGTLAGLALFAAFTFQTTGIGYTTASNASFITGLAVVFTPLFALLLLRVQPNRQQAFGAAMAAVGLALLTLSAFSVHVGDLLVLGCAVFTALHIVVLSKVSKNHDAEVLAFVQVMVVGVLSLAWSVVTGGFSIPHTSQALTTIVVVGIGGTAIGYFVQTKAQVESSPSRIALILVLEPVFGGLFGYLLGGDRLSAVNLSGRS
ncbi:DMT family transporter [Paraburkholderia sp.]|uniref:DMT family transporter n=1 Tax=Paraburkholderia sp. TaxID=1926495 RepID=UPI003C79E5BD